MRIDGARTQPKRAGDLTPGLALAIVNGADFDDVIVVPQIDNDERAKAPMLLAAGDGNPISGR